MLARSSGPRWSSPRLHRPALRGQGLRAYGLSSPAWTPAKKCFPRFFVSRSKRRASGSCVVAAKASSKKGTGIKQGRGQQPLLVTLEVDGTDLWRLDPVIRMLREGSVLFQKVAPFSVRQQHHVSQVEADAGPQIGILPTDTYPALVCDITARNAVERLYAAKGLAPSKQLSILCRTFSDINTYTMGFPASSLGRKDLFRLARQALPGPFTLILHASKELPKQCVDFLSGKSKARRTVGVRIPANDICQEVLQNLDAPLISTSVHGEEEGGIEVVDAAVMADMYAGCGLDFIVDTGATVPEGSTVIDLTGSEPVLVREGKGDSSIFV